MTETDRPKPLAARLRPRFLTDFVGQDHMLAPGKLLERLIHADQITSLIFFGPPGTGKTSLASIIAATTQSCFVKVNAVASSVKEIRDILQRAQNLWLQEKKKTILFIDELHRFNKAQQDILMPAVEEGDISLIGATIHNPAFSIISPLLSRSHVFEFKSLSPMALQTICRKAIQFLSTDQNCFVVDITEDAINYLISSNDGDARRLLNVIELCVCSSQPERAGTLLITLDIAKECSQNKIIVYDKNEDGHYDTISAFIKSLRGSDPDAALYWLAKMIAAGEDPLFIARRLVIFASEDVGNADPHGILVAMSVFSAVQAVGLPEARINLAQATSYLATAPKSNASYMAYESAADDVLNGRVDDVPQNLKNKHLYGEDLDPENRYKYSHQYSGAYVVQDYFALNKEYYHPTDRGYEKHIKVRLEEWRKKKSVKKS